VNLATGLGLSIALVVIAVTFAWKYLIHARGQPWPGRPTPPRTT
jgi:hypothetical protein